MISLDKVKLILWDFDDTLCFHSWHGSAKDEFDTEYNVGVLSGKDVYSTCQSNSFIKTFIQSAKESGIRQGLISGTTSYIHMRNKENWVREHYDIGLENYCVCSQDMKLGMMLALAQANNFKHDEILIVDDFWNVLERACDNGFQACTPMEIVNFVTEHKI